MNESEIEAEEIRLCLSCPLPDCINCLKDFDEARPVRRLIRVRELAEQGLSDAQIGRVIGMHRNSVLRMRRKLGIPGLGGRQKERTA
ncbi:MAG: hypothetical protein K6G17_01660 [Oscillospiraceae bacterium]|nr:hypothetical protein [Oscillospiraceae bacterium]